MAWSDFPLWVYGADWAGLEVGGDQRSAAARSTALHWFRPDSEGVLWSTVGLVPVADDPTDPLAVDVMVGPELCIGRLNRGESARWWPVLARVAESGHVATTWCSAGYGPDGPRFTVHLSEPDDCLPVNSPPLEPHVLLPDGDEAEVELGPGASAAARLCPTGGRGRLLLTLHVVQPVPAVEVRLDGVPVGVLADADAAELGPIVDRNATRGLLSTAMGVVEEGGAGLVRLGVRAARSPAMGADERSAPGLVPVRPDGRYRLPGAVAVPQPAGTPFRPVKAGCSWIVVACCVIVMLSLFMPPNDVLQTLGIGLVTLGTVLPAAWWLACERLDRVAAVEAAERGDPPERMPRRWALVWAVAVVTCIVGFVVFPTSGSPA